MHYSSSKGFIQGPLEPAARHTHKAIKPTVASFCAANSSSGVNVKYGDAFRLPISCAVGGRCGFGRAHRCAQLLIATGGGARPVGLAKSRVIFSVPRDLLRATREARAQATRAANVLDFYTPFRSLSVY